MFMRNRFILKITFSLSIQNINDEGEHKMGDKNIKKEVKKKKKTDVKVSAPSTFVREVVTQPQLITKKKKDK